MRRLTTRAGFTLIELLVSLTITAVVIGGAVTAANRGVGLFRESTSNSAINTRTVRAVCRVTQELLGAEIIPPNPVPPFGSATLDFRVGLGWVDNDVDWGAPRRIAFELEGGEFDNGLDDNGNGLVDEGSVVMTVNRGEVDEQRVVLVNGVSELLEGELANGIDDNGNGLRDEAGLSFEREGDVLTVRLTLEQIKPNGVRSVRTQESSIRLRN